MNVRIRLPMSIGCLAVGALACGDAGGEQLNVPLLVQGSAPQPVAIRGGTLELEQAQLALGPLYLCASPAAELELCETAVGELLEVHTVDLLQPEPRALSTLSAVSGTVRGAFFDYGISWLLTDSAARPTMGAVEGHSARLAGSAVSDGGAQLTFTVDVDIAPIARGTAAVHGRAGEHTLQRGSQLTLRIDASSWLKRIRFEELAALDADGDGQLHIPPGSQPYEAIVQAMTLNAVPSFDWQ